MKREKIIFTFFVIPIFLFSTSLKHWKLDREKNKNSVLFPQQITSLKKVQSLQSKGNNGGLDQGSPKIKPDFPEQAKDSSSKAYRPREAEIFTPGGNRDLRSERTKKPYRPVIRHQIKHLNQGLPYRYEGPHYVPDQVLVKFKPTLSEQMRGATIEAYESKITKRNIRLNRYKVKIPKNYTLEEMIYILSQNPDVEYVGPIYKAFVAVTPNDPLFDYQYALYNSGQDIGPPGSPQGKERADIKATSTWEETQGNENIIIAVIDTGVDYNHEDLAANIWINQPEYDGENGFDDDGNGYIDDVHGYDFVNDDGDPTDDEGHGTHVAGIAAAETHNQEGIAGVAWNCTILPIKALDENGESEDYVPLILGIDWAVDNGAHVINLSLGGFGPDPDLLAALKRAHENDVVVVAAAGNDGGAVIYPAAYDDYCLAVAATNYNDERVTLENSSDDPRYKWESNYGPEIDVAAPGARIISTVPIWFWGPDSFPYAWGDGTSLASPQVAGLAALIKSVKPHLTASQIMNVIRYSADDVNSADNLGKDNFIGYGRINMDKALVPIVIKPSR